MSFSKYLYESSLLKIVIEEDTVGFYLIIYRDPLSEKSDEDYLFDSLEDAFREAKDKFGIARNQWRLINNGG